MTKRIATPLPFVATAIAALLLAAPVRAQSSGPAFKWQTNYARAAAIARATDKPIMIYIQGSDWCPYCIKLEKDVLQTRMFTDWAQKHVVPLTIDFPKAKRQPDTIKRQNEKLKHKYQIAKTPTFLFIDKDGEEIARAGWDEAHLRKEEAEGAPIIWMTYLRNLVKAERPTEDLAVAKTLPEAVAQAKADKLPVLMFITNGQYEVIDKTRDQLHTNQNFVRWANTNVTYTELEWPADTDDTEAAKAARQFIAKHRIVDRNMQLIMWDSKKDAIVARMPSINTARMDRMLMNLNRALPPIPYDGGWLDDPRAAHAISAQTGRDLFICFTQYETSEWCKKYKEEILDTSDFKSYARRNLVLLNLDFSKTDSFTAERKKKLDQIADLYAVRGFPTGIIVNSKGDKIGTTKYMKGGPGPYIRELNRVIKEDRDRRTLLSEKYGG